MGRRLHAWVASLVLGAFAVCAACSRHGERRRVPPASAASITLGASSAAGASAASAQQRADQAQRACELELRALEAQPELPGSPLNAGQERALVLARARAEPVIFMRAPRKSTRLSHELELLQTELDAEHPMPAFERLLALAKKHPELAREVLLREGYLYTESAELAALEVNFLALGLLFREPVLELLRGDESFRLRRHPDGEYRYESGPQQGQRATLWLLDRVTIAGQDPGPPLTLGLRRAQAQAGASELTLEHLSEQGAIARLRYGARELRAVLRRQGGQLELGCSLVPREAAAEVEREHALSVRRARVNDVLARVVAGEIAEELPFDEPRTEEGQQDGQLRPAWRRAYANGWDVYTFNDDRYWVFDRLGRPRVPQVCIDFVMDTLERASGSWFHARGEKRERSAGRLDFDQFGLDNRRSVESFVAFSKSHPEWFEVAELDGAARVPFYEREAFYQALFARRDAFHAFDIVVIFGLRADGKLHYHSFFVADTDPLTGMPIAVVANAGRPRIRSWENEMQSAPQRSVIAHIQPRLTWLESIVPSEPNLSAEPPISATSPG